MFLFFFNPFHAVSFHERTCFLNLSSTASSANQQQQPSLRHLGPSQPQQQNHHLQQSSPTAAILRNEVARQLMMLGFHDQAGLLISADSGSLEDLEKFLCKYPSSLDLFIAVSSNSTHLDLISPIYLILNLRRLQTGQSECCLKGFRSLG